MILEKISNYINQFPEETRDVVMETILKSIALNEVFESKEGMAIISGVFETMTNNVARIVSLAAGGKFDEKKDEIRVAAEEIAFLRSQLVSRARNLTRGKVSRKESATKRLREMDEAKDKVEKARAKRIRRVESLNKVVLVTQRKKR